MLQLRQYFGSSESRICCCRGVSETCGAEPGAAPPGAGAPEVEALSCFGAAFAALFAEPACGAIAAIDADPGPIGATAASDPDPGLVATPASGVPGAAITGSGALST